VENQEAERMDDHLNGYSCSAVGCFFSDLWTLSVARSVEYRIHNGSNLKMMKGTQFHTERKSPSDFRGSFSTAVKQATTL